MKASEVTKKYVLVKICFGTIPYLTPNLEMDIKDDIGYEVLEAEELESRDVIRIVGQSDNKAELEESKREYDDCDAMANYYNPC